MTYVRVVTITVSLRTISPSAADAERFERELERRLVSVANEHARAKRHKVWIVEPAPQLDANL